MFSVGDGAMLVAEDDVAWREGLCFARAGRFGVFTRSACEEESTIA